MNNIISEEYCWNILDNNFKTKGFVHHQTESFDHFVNVGLPKIVCDEPPIVIIPDKENKNSGYKKYTVSFSDVYIPSPTVIEEDRILRGFLPSEARQRDLYYDSPIYVTVTTQIDYEDSPSEIEKHFRVVIGRIPIMLRSSKCYLSNLKPEDRIKAGECEKDEGGYFIIKGKERVIIPQVRGVYNVPKVIEQKPGEKFKFLVEIRSMSEETGHSALVKVMLGSDDRTLAFSIPYIKDIIPIGILFKSLGYLENDIRNFIGLNCDNVEKYIRLIIRDSFVCDEETNGFELFLETHKEEYEIKKIKKNWDELCIEDQNKWKNKMTCNNALKYIGKQSIHTLKENERINYAKQVVENELFPHMGITSTKKEKAYFLGYIVQKLLATVVGLRKEDDRDDYINKRVESTGVLFYDLFRQIFKKYTSTIVTNIEKKKQVSDVMSIIPRLPIITNGIRVCMGSGNWGLPKNLYVRSGVSQILSRLSYGATVSNLRRISIPVGKESKNAKIRQIHPSQIMFICPAECFDPETQILMMNGSCKRAGDIVVGDVLVDDFGNPTTVRTTCSGMKYMYDVIPDNKNFMKHRVTDNHILTLRILKHKQIESHQKDKNNIIHLVYFFNRKEMEFQTRYFASISEAKDFIKSFSDDDKLDIKIQDYLKLSKQTRKYLVLFKVNSINWKKKNVKINPYLLGIWIGNDLKNNNFKFSNSRKAKSPVKQYFYNEIPSEYLINNKTSRFNFLAGLIESNNNNNTICFTNNFNNSLIIYNIYDLINNLGLSYVVNEFSNFKEIKIEGYKKEFVYSNFSLVNSGIGLYVGWQLEEKSGRFCLKDGIVVHNTPEGAQIGIVLNLSLLTRISERFPTVLVKEVVEKCENLILLENCDTINENTKVFLNGLLCGVTENPYDLVDEIKNFRKINMLPYDVSISYDDIDDEINIYSDEGRLLRPLFIVENNKLKIKVQDGTNWDELVRKDLIKYVDNNEINNSVIAFNQNELGKYNCDYCEIAAAMMLGVMASIIPFSDHSQSPRNLYQSSMGKQAMSMFALSHLTRSDTITHVLTYPQKPLVYTKTGNMLGFSDMPSGMNAIVAVACYGGWNQEDSVMLNKSAVQRGMFWATSYRTHSEEEKKQGSMFDSIGLPPLDKRRKDVNYSLLDENGIVRLRQSIYKDDEGKSIGGGGSVYVEAGDVIVGKVLIQNSKNDKEEITDNSVVIKKGEEGFIDRIFVSTTPNGYKLVKIVIRTERIPEVGDKFACYDPETEILTKNGWKKINDITIKDHVASLQEGKKLEYVQPTEIQEYDFEGKMYYVKSTKIDLMVTPNHRMYTTDSSRKRYKIQIAEEIYGKTRLYKNNVDKWEPKNKIQKFILPRYEELPDLELNLKTWCIFFGIWISYHKNGTTNKHCIQQNLEKCMEIHMSKGELVHWQCNDRRLIYYLKPYTINQKLPEWCFDLDMYYSQKLLEGMFFSNSYHMTSKDKIRYYTSSIRLRDDIQHLCLHSGWVCNYFNKSETGSKTICQGKKISTDSDYWCLTISKKQKSALVNKNINKGKQLDSWVDYKGKVYCCRVPTNEGVVFVRRRGKSYWCGNSRSAQKGTCGSLLDQENMPYTGSGIVPDLIMNPHALPSRMTINQLMECVLGKSCVMEGKFGDSTPFTESSVGTAKQICERLGMQNFEPTGTESLYNGMTGEYMGEVFIGPVYYQRLKHLVAEKIHCLKGDHDVLTINGWKNITDINLTDKVATLENNKLVYINPIKILHYPEHEGNIHYISNSSIDLAVTENHRMWVSKSYREKRIYQENYSFIEAKDLIGNQVRYKKDAIWESFPFQFILPFYEKIVKPTINKTIQEKNIDMNAWLILFGTCFAEVCTSGYETSGQIEFYVNKQKVKDTLYESLKILDYKFIIKEEKLSIYDYQLYQYMKQFSVCARNKKLPQWVFKLDTEQSRLLVNTMLVGCKFYYTSSVQLADQFQQLCLHSGWCGNISINDHKENISNIDNSEIVSKYDILKISVITKRINPIVNHGHKKKNIIVYEKCPVYCLQVPSEVFYVRRNGKAVWTGNSRSTGPNATLTRQPLEGRSRQGGLRFGEMERDAVISMGASRFLKERLFEQSDPYTVMICDLCGNFATSFSKCKACNTDKISKVNIPYVSKLVIQELNAMSIKCKIEAK